MHTIYISYIAWRSTELNLLNGKYVGNIENKIEISHIPEGNVGRNYARIFGITGFIVNWQDTDFMFSTHWTGAKFVFDFDANTPFTKYVSFEYIFLLGS